MSGRTVAVLVALALAARVLVVLVTPHFVPQTDSADFDRMAVSLAQHGRFPPSLLTGGPTALRPPLFPLSLAAVYKVVGVGSASTRWEAGRLVEAALGAIAVGLIALIAFRLWGRRAALVAGGLAAVYPPLVLVGSSIMSESLFIPLVLGAVLTALYARDSARDWAWALASGLLIGLASLTRGNGIALAIPLGFLVWSARPRLTRRAAVAPAVLLAAAVLTLVPWTVRNANAFHAFVPITTETGGAIEGTFNSYAAHRTDFPALWLPPVTDIEGIEARHPHLNEAQLSDRLNTLAFHYVRAHPGYVAKVFWWNTLRLLNLTGAHFERWAARYEAYPAWLAVTSVYAFWAAALLAVAAIATRTARGAPWALWGCPLVVFLSTVFFLGSTRYRSPADPFVVMLAALGILGLWGVLAEGRLPSRVRLPSPAG